MSNKQLRTSDVPKPDDIMCGAAVFCKYNADVIDVKDE